MNMKKAQGFTLIELMIVVAIIAILAAIALPAYQNYIKRSKVTEGIVAADACKSSIAEYVGTNNKYPADSDTAGCAQYQQTQYVSSLAVDNAGKITVTYQNIGDGVDGKNYILQPDSDTTVSTGQVHGWICTSSDVDKKYLPASCRG